MSGRPDRGDDTDPQRHGGNGMTGVGSQHPRLGKPAQQRFPLGRQHAERVGRIDSRHAELEPPIRRVEVDGSLDPDLHPVGHPDGVAVTLEQSVDPLTGISEQHDRHGRDRWSARGFGRLDQIEVDVTAAASADALNLALDPDAVGHRLLERGPDNDTQFGDGEGLFTHIQHPRAVRWWARQAAPRPRVSPPNSAIAASRSSGRVLVAPVLAFTTSPSAGS